MMNDKRRVVVIRFEGNTNVNTDIFAQYLSSFTAHDLSENPEKIYPSFFRQDGYYYGSSCRGLMCFQDSKSPDVVVWNPTTKEFRALPPSDVEYPPPDPHPLFGSGVKISSTNYEPIGFGFDAASEGYKFVRFMEHYYEEEIAGDDRPMDCGSSTQVEMYSFNSDSWKEIPNPPECYISTVGSVYVDGSYYWTSTDSFIYSFDFAKETFSPTFPLPTTKVSDDCLYNLVDLDGLLGVLVSPRFGFSKCIELWVVSIINVDERSWTKVYDVTLDGVWMPLGIDGVNARFLLLEEINMDHPDTSRPLQLLVYDRATQEMKKTGIYDYPRTMQIYPYVESTAPLPKPNQTIA